MTAPAPSRSLVLGSSLQALAREPVLLVGCDYDGTVAPIVDNPHQARPLRETVTALRGLASLPDTHVALISGRGLRDLAALSRLPEEIHLVGSHGSEFDLDFSEFLDEATRSLLGRLRYDVERIAGSIGDGLIVEHKPAGVALHYRRSPANVARRARRAVEQGPAAIDGVFVRHGKQVVELSVVKTSKGTALETIRRQVGASAVIFVGDDVTDEDAFATLRGPDLGIKVGPGTSSAGARVEDHLEVARILVQLLGLRRAWLEGDRPVPIERHALLSDHRTLALVSPDARIVWMCHPRGDSAALFAELLGGSAGGTFAVRPAHGAPPLSQRYHERSLVLETRWPRISVTDYLDCGANLPREPAERSNLLRVLSGSGAVDLEFAPRLDFARAATRLVPTATGLEITGSNDPFVLVAPGVHWTIVDDGRHQRATATVDLDPARPVVLELRCGSRDPSPPDRPEPERRRETTEWWSGWAAGLHLPSVAYAAVLRSALTLKALCYEPTGGMYAAATSSLPETIGGVRNWDYRYCWIRDAAMAAEALVELGSSSEAEAYLRWFAGVMSRAPSPDRVHPVYGVTGDPIGHEAAIDVLPGYAGSRPVRIGNAADSQIQTDVFGPVLRLMDAMTAGGVALDDGMLAMIRGMVVAVRRGWRKPDHGIWEIRHAPMDHVYSKVMCWVALDRAIRILHRGEVEVPSSWGVVRDRIRADVLEHGWDAAMRCFTGAYGRSDLDAAALHVGLSGLVHADDPRFRETIQAVEIGLRRGPAVYRYLGDDGLPGYEGGFHLCTGWLVEAYVLTGRLDDAHALFDQFVELAGPTGLLSEEYDPTNERALGNHPQAYSHLALIRAAVRLDAAGVAAG